MIIGVPKEVKAQEARVGLTPAAARELVGQGHSVLIECGAGSAIGHSDEQYQAAGARTIDTAEAIWRDASLIIKVKEPQASEYGFLRENQILFTYLHLAAAPQLAKALQKSGTAALAYETVTDAQGHLPLLTPMSEIAGRMAVQAAARCLELPQGGRGVLLGGVPGVRPATVTILGGGVVGTNAARMAVGLGAEVSVLDRSLSRLRYLDDIFQGKLCTVYSTRETIEAQLQASDVVIGAVLSPGASAPKLVTREHLSLMRPDAVVVDVAIDQGGCFASSHPTTHADPTYIMDGIVHYCVSNIPGAVARTATDALNHATLPYISQLADRGLDALQEPGLNLGLNVYRGKIVHRAVAESLQDV